MPVFGDPNFANAASQIATTMFGNPQLAQQAEAMRARNNLYSAQSGLVGEQGRLANAQRKFAEVETKTEENKQAAIAGLPALLSGLFTPRPAQSMDPIGQFPQISPVDSEILMPENFDPFGNQVATPAPAPARPAGLDPQALSQALAGYTQAGYGGDMLKPVIAAMVQNGGDQNLINALIMQGKALNEDESVSISGQRDLNYIRNLADQFKQAGINDTTRYGADIEAGTKIDIANIEAESRQAIANSAIPTPLSKTQVEGGLAAEVIANMKAKGKTPLQINAALNTPAFLSPGSVLVGYDENGNPVMGGGPPPREDPLSDFLSREKLKAARDRNQLADMQREVEVTSAMEKFFKKKSEAEFSPWGKGRVPDEALQKSMRDRAFHHLTIGTARTASQAVELSFDEHDKAHGHTKGGNVETAGGALMAGKRRYNLDRPVVFPKEESRDRLSEQFLDRGAPNTNAPSPNIRYKRDASGKLVPDA